MGRGCSHHAEPAQDDARSLRDARTHGASNPKEVIARSLIWLIARGRAGHAQWMVRRYARREV